MPPCERIPALNVTPAPGGADLRRRLLDAPLHVVGRVVDASNAVLLARLDDDAEPVEHVVYKPIAGERPLWDFPDGHLAHREVAASLLAHAGGWTCIPPTVLRVGPAGAGSVQRWVTDVPHDPFADVDESGDPASSRDGEPVARATDVPDDSDDTVAGAAAAAEHDEVGGVFSEEADPDHVQLFDPSALPAGWLPVLSGELGDGRAVVLAHRDAPDLRSLAVLDAVLNNSDRKGSHVLVGRDGRLWGIDHGLTCHAEPKLRTVLWGWAGEALADDDIARLERLEAALADARPETDAEVAAWVSRPTSLPASLPAALDRLLTVDEVDALRARIRRLLRRRRHPHPSRDWPAVPWPPL